jgi:hypothetical protein
MNELDASFDKLIKAFDKQSQTLIRMQLAMAGFYVFAIALVLIDIFLFEAH